MATAPDASIDDLNRQSARLEAESRKLRAEADKLNAEHYKLVAEQYKLESERLKIDRDKTLSPWLLLAQGLIGGAALLGSALALLKYLSA
ncbi:hypothetical protein [Sphingomonas bacterium]|uniref:hypothetical protein n=1 Tax=Sphingomonas bacterium TaxID=1895847 RepID=UPI00157694EF|nr:hypothetical protein [Sphingomonas bacterium]